MKEITWALDANLEEVKKSAARWRQACKESLQALPQNNKAYDLVMQTVRAASDFETVIDPMRHQTVPFDANKVQTALTRLQSTVWESINELNTLSDKEKYRGIRDGRG
ncbi:hypothetical protein ABT174_37980 [Streptomyces sparsogenes]|uniref:hypothetical protein n=1 Tax=Streptomyces sparsogenes TaxID=67365 RepID=UPI003323E6E0